jgi:hypothetical protein
MRSLALVFAATVTVLGAMTGTTPAHADGVCTPAAPATWGVTATTPSTDDTPVGRARDLLARARLLDEAAAADEKSANEIGTRLPTLRASAKTARDRADHASGNDRETLVSRAEDLEADLAVSEAEATAKRQSALENRRVARELRTRAVRLVREAPSEPPSSPCDPPYRFTADGRKIYRIECLK